MKTYHLQLQLNCTKDNSTKFTDIPSTSTLKGSFWKQNKGEESGKVTLVVLVFFIQSSDL